MFSRVLDKNGKPSCVSNPLKAYIFVLSTAMLFLGFFFLRALPYIISVYTYRLNSKTSRPTVPYNYLSNVHTKHLLLLHILYQKKKYQIKKYIIQFPHLSISIIISRIYSSKEQKAIVLIVHNNACTAE